MGAAGAVPGTFIFIFLVIQLSSVAIRVDDYQAAVADDQGVIVFALFTEADVALPFVLLFILMDHDLRVLASYNQHTRWRGHADIKAAFIPG